MIKILNRATWKLAAITIILAGNLCVIAAPKIQGDIEPKVAEAIVLFRNGQIQKAIAQFREIGDPAVPAARELLQTDVGSRGMPQLLLSGFIASTEGEGANVALVELLSDSSPYLRGVAASSIGKRKLKAAVPQLISLLNDKEVYLTTHVTHPNGYDREPSSIDVPTLVRDAAIDALQLITGKKLARSASREKQAQAWLQWWQKQKARK